MYDEYGNRIVYRKENSFLKNVLILVLIALVLYTMYLVSENTGGINLNAIIPTAEVVYQTTEPVSTPVVISPTIVVPTVEQPVMAEPVQAIVPTQVITVLTDGGLPEMGPYSLDEVNQCRALLDSGALLKSPQSELCKMYTQ